jgi:SNF2 family DNA or RNA helicase
VVFCNFRHDLDAIGRVAAKLRRTSYELSGRVNQLAEWQEKGKELGAILVVQIQAGAEGVDMTQACHAIYYSLPYSLALYNQSRARLYRPGQKRPVSFIHMLAKNTIDEGIYAALERKEEIIDQIKAGTFDFGYAKK